jgi:hypothetical protein
MAAVYTQEEWGHQYLLLFQQRETTPPPPVKQNFSQGETWTTGIAIEKKGRAELRVRQLLKTGTDAWQL